MSSLLGASGEKDEDQRHGRVPHSTRPGDPHASSQLEGMPGPPPALPKSGLTLDEPSEVKPRNMPPVAEPECAVWRGCRTRSLRLSPTSTRCSRSSHWADRPSEARSTFVGHELGAGSRPDPLRPRTTGSSRQAEDVPRPPTTRPNSAKRVSPPRARARASRVPQSVFARASGAGGSS